MYEYGYRKLCEERNRETVSDVIVIANKIALT